MIYSTINSQNRQLSIIQQLKVLSRGCLIARQRSIALIYSALRYLVTYSMDNEGAADRDREGNEEEAERWRGLIRMRCKS